MTVTDVPILACCRGAAVRPYRLLADKQSATSPPVYSRAAVHHLLLLAGAARRHRVMPKTSVAAASLVVVSSLVSARSEAFAVSHELLSDTVHASLSGGLQLGLCGWQARRGRPPSLRPSDRCDRATVNLSPCTTGAGRLVHCTANFGCRPTFLSAALLASPCSGRDSRWYRLRTRRIKPLQRCARRWR